MAVIPSSLAGKAAGTARRYPRQLRARIREADFWYIQAAILLITIFHYWTDYGPASFLYRIPVLLYVLPIVYAAVRYGREGGILTGVWIVVLSLPDLFTQDREGLRWVGELIEISVILFIGTVISWRVDQEARKIRSYVLQVTRAQEEERKRIARELHDQTAQELAILRRDLEDIQSQESLAAGGKDRIARASRLAGSALDGVRRYAQALRPAMLDDLGLVPALEALAGDVQERSGLRIHVSTNGIVRRLDSEVELNVFRVAQEAVRNIEKHAMAKTASVLLAFGRGDLRLTVSDDGHGMPGHVAGAREANGHLGISGMRERARILGARLDIASSPRGTSVVLSVPVSPPR